MIVFYNSSLWSKGKSLPGLPQRTNWQFEYAGTKRCLPVIYRFPKGIVFDVITFLDKAKVQSFFEKYDTIEQKLTSLQRRCAEQEHPYQSVPIKEIWINGKRVKNGYSASSTLSIPWAQQHDDLALVRKADASILKDTACFACERFCVPYPETNSRTQQLLRLLRLGRVNNLKLSTYSVPWFSPLDIHFEMSTKEDEKVICFKHPVTGITHTLYFQVADVWEIPLGPGDNRSFYAAQSIYEIDPALPQGDTLQFNSSSQYREPPTDPSEDKYAPIAASSIGIIGGADGPTAVFVAAKDKEEAVTCGLHGLPLHSCFAVPVFHKKDIYHFVLEGINIKYLDGQEYSFQ